MASLPGWTQIGFWGRTTHHRATSIKLPHGVFSWFGSCQFQGVHVRGKSRSEVFIGVNKNIQLLRSFFEYLSLDVFYGFSNCVLLATLDSVTFLQRSEIVCPPPLNVEW